MVSVCGGLLLFPQNYHNTISFHLITDSGTNPPRLYQRVNDTINISCSVENADGILSFWDGKERVPEKQLNVNNEFICCCCFNWILCSLSYLVNL